LLLLYLFYRFIKYIIKQKKENTFKRQFAGEYNRDLPYEWNFIDLQYIFGEINLASNNNIFTALLLKWMYEDRLSIETELSGRFKKSHQVILQFHDPGEFDNKTEEEIFYLLMRYADAYKQLNQSDYLR